MRPDKDDRGVAVQPVPQIVLITREPDWSLVEDNRRRLTLDEDDAVRRLLRLWIDELDRAVSAKVILRLVPEMPHVGHHLRDQSDPLPLDLLGRLHPLCVARTS
jgi:hypothetical protein